MDTPLKFEKKRDVLARIPFSRATLHRKINKGIFPPPISLGDRTPVFLSHEIDAFIAALANGEDLTLFIPKLVAKRCDLMASLPSFLLQEGNKEGQR